MAGNSERIDEIVNRPAVEKQINDTINNLIELEIQLADTAKGAALLNTELAKSQTFRQYQQSATKAASETAKLEAAQVKLVAANERLQQEIARTAAAQSRATTASNQAQVSNARTAQSLQTMGQRAAAASGEYARLMTAYRAAELAARNAGAQFGINSNQFIDASANVRQLRGQLDSIDQPLGNFQRNVGNYTNGIVRFGQRAFGAIRLIANVLPGLGLSGAFLLIFEGLKFVVEKLGLLEEGTSRYKEILSSLNSVNKEASKQAGEQATNLRILYAAATDVTNSMESRLRAARELKKEFPDTFKNLKTEAILNGDSKVAYDKLTASILENAKARAAVTKIQELQSKIYDIDFQNQKIENARINETSTARIKAIKNQTEALEFELKRRGETITEQGKQASRERAIQGVVTNLEPLINKRAADAKKLTEQSRGIIQAQIDFLTKYAGGNNKLADSLSTGETPTTPKAPDNRRKDLDDQLNEIKQTEEKILNSEQSSFLERIAAVEKFEKDSEAVIRKGVLNKVLRVQEGANKVSEIENLAREQQEKIQKDLGAYLKAEQDRRLKEQNDGLAKEVLNFQDAQNQRLLEIDQARSKASSLLARQYADGVISAKQYNKQLYDIDEAAALARADVQIGVAEAIVKAQAAALALGFGSAKDLQKSTNDLAKLQMQKSDLVTTNELNNIRKIEDARRQLAAKEKELADASLTLIQTIVDAGYQRQIDALEEQSKKIDDNAEQEKKAVDRSLLSSQQKADKNAIIDAQAAAQKELIAQKEKKIRQDQAKFDRAVAIARIIQETAIAVVQALAIPIVGIALAATIGALGAVQLATVLATPLPQYAKGGTVGKDGHIITGELGTELRIDPDGTHSLTKDHANVSYAKKGTKIIPHMELMGMLRAQELKYVGGQAIDIAPLIKAIKENKPQPSKKPVLNGWGGELRDYNNYTAYRNNHFR